MVAGQRAGGMLTHASPDDRAARVRRAVELRSEVDATDALERGKPMNEFQLESSARIQAIDITALVARRVADDGLLWLSTPHTTAALFLCEADAKMLADVEKTAGKLLAPLEPFTHDKNDEPNAVAHLFSSLMGTQLLVRVVDGRLRMGDHQRIVFLELDGPRQRRVWLEAVAVAAAVDGTERR
jgi:secondary thiamine-phosphate synthase enzyme